MKLIVVGDPHIREESGESRGVDTAVHMTQLVQHINSHHADAAYCLAHMGARAWMQVSCTVQRYIALQLRRAAGL